MNPEAVAGAGNAHADRIAGTAGDQKNLIPAQELAAIPGVAGPPVGKIRRNRIGTAHLILDRLAPLNGLAAKSPLAQHMRSIRLSPGSARKQNDQRK